MIRGIAQPHPAVIAIDLHRGHLDPEIATMPLEAGMAARVVAANAKFLRWCRAASIPVFHCVATYRDADEIRANPGWRARAEDPNDLRNNVLVHNLKGSPGCTIMPEVFDPSDFVIDAKKRYDCFFATDLDLGLRAHGVDTVARDVSRRLLPRLCGRGGFRLRRHDGRRGFPSMGAAHHRHRIRASAERRRDHGARAFAENPEPETRLKEPAMTSHMIPRERCDYSAIVDRPPLKLPGGARLAFWTIVNYEVWDISRPMARQVLPAPTGVPLLPDVPNWSWHEYGMRVGAWRFFELYSRLGIRPTLATNARVCEDYPRVAEQAKRDGWEFMSHAYDQLPIHKHDDQAAMIKRSMDILERFTGKRPVGWLGPGLTETYETPELLAAAGVKYIGDWVFDDEPTVIRTANGPLVTLPYTVELNDIPMMIVQHHESEYLMRRAIDQFDRLYAEGRHR
ncbi:MAG: isochorismatase family protein, partial [Alphaproteobacteria bacterium]